MPDRPGGGGDAHVGARGEIIMRVSWPIDQRNKYIPHDD